MAQIPVQIIEKSDVVLTYNPASLSDTVLNTNFDVLYEIKNDSLIDITATISAIAPCDQGEYHNVFEVISAGTRKIIPLTSRLTNWSTKIVTIGLSSIDGVSVAAYRQIK